MGYLGATDQQDIWSLFNIAWDFAQEGYLPTLKRVVEHVAGWFQANGASLLMRQEEEGSVYRLVCSTGLDTGGERNVAVRPGDGIAGACIELGRPLLIHDPTMHPSLNKKAVGKRRGIESAMVVPLVTPVSGCIGVLSVSRSAGRPRFNDADLVQAESVARHLALAVENVRLFSKAAEATRQAVATHAKLREIIRCLGVAVLVIDAHEELTDANREALKLLKKPRGRDSSPCLVPSIWEGLREALKGKTIRRRIHDDHEDRSWSLVCTPIKGGGAAATVEEVTEHERARSDLNRMRRLAEIGQMSAAIAHEIRNPLTGIRSAAQLVRQAPDQASELGEIIEQETLKLNELCDDFLDFARPLALRIEPADLATIARGVQASHATEFEAAGVTLTVQIEGEKPIIEGDARRLEQVMRNLLLNALQACDRGQRVALVITQNGFRVEDTGQGMDEATLEGLFVPFFTTKAHGSGLGLSTVRKVVDAHGGDIRVRSEVGKGSVFEIALKEG
jgi:C4-dicarboxylate-specific signal transduction histidine kinase